MTEATATPTLVTPQLIVGLGNPEKKYEQTRHNIGFEAIDLLASRWNISMAQNKRFQGWFGESVGPKGIKIRVLKPLTYMNRSGQAIRAVTDWYKISPTSVFVIYDDMDLPIGRIRLRLSGSAGGHNGMKSTIAHLGTQNFPRLRIGIGKPADTEVDRTTISHVLGKFSPDETPIVSDVLQLAIDSVEFSLKQGVEKAMSLYNGRTIA